MISKTTKRTTRRSPASDIAATKADAQRNGMRRYFTKACPECHHRVRLLPEGACERCTITAILDDEDGTTAEQRKWARNLEAASQRGPATYRVTHYLPSRKAISEEHERDRQLQEARRKAEGAVGLLLAAMEDEPEFLRRASMWVPGMSHPWDHSVTSRSTRSWPWSIFGRTWAT
jgi:hypothetical protein